MRSNSLLRNILGATLIAGTLLLLFLLVQHLMRATIIITLQDGQDTVIQTVGISPKTIASSNKPGKNTFRVARGEYTITVSDEKRASKATVKLGFRGKAEPSLELVDPLYVIQSSSRQVLSAGFVDDNIATLDADSLSVRNLDGKIMGVSDGLKTRKVVFSNDRHFLIIDAYGLLFIADNKDGSVNLSNTSPDFRQVVAGSYDSIAKKFCVLSSDKQVGWVDPLGNGVDGVTFIETSQQLDTITCSGGTAVVSNLDRDFDGETRLTARTTRVFVVSGGTTTSFDVHDLSAAVAVDSQHAAYISAGAVYLYKTASDEASIIHTTQNNNKNALVSISGDLYVYDRNELWRVSNEGRTAHRVLAHPDLTGIVATNQQGGGIIFSISVGLQRGAYATTENESLLRESQRLSLKLPYVGDDFIVEKYFDGEKIVIRSTNLAPIPSHGSTAIYDTTTEKITTFVRGLGIDTALIQVKSN